MIKPLYACSEVGIAYISSGRLKVPVLVVEESRFKTIKSATGSWLVRLIARHVFYDSISFLNRSTPFLDFI